MTQLKSLSAHEINKPRNRRLRKKLRTAEFREYGIDIQIFFRRESISFDTALDLWIDFVDSKGWAFGGGGNEGGESFSGFICHPGRGTLAEPDLLAIQAWSKEQNWITCVTQNLQDAWHSN
ncbi:DUF469 family protein [Pseudomonas sp. IC_126]|nr:DUF469 family protein [Pseudomonas sp. IC_126]